MCVLLYIVYFIHSIQTVLFVGSRPALSVESLAHVFKSHGRATLQWNPSLLMTSPRILISSARGVPERERVCLLCNIHFIARQAVAGWQKIG